MDAAAETAAIDHLRALVRIPTISRPTSGPGPRADRDTFERFIAALPGLYPRVHATLSVERHGTDPDDTDGPRYSLLYRWVGSDPAGAAAPTVLMAHYDVVPATDDGWQHPPFAAERLEHDGEEVVWGRGTIDNKGALVAILEAVEGLLATGFMPRHDVLLVFGHDEEVAGTGAQAIVAALHERGTRPALVVDEGGAIVRDVFGGIASDIALIGLAEKGITTLTARVDQKGGHAASPPPFAATERLARAIMRLNAQPAPAQLDSTARLMIRTLGAHMTGLRGLIFRRVDLFAPLILRALLARGAETTALLRTTRAVTVLRAGQSANALPEFAEATINIRIVPGSSVADALAQVSAAINDPEVTLEATESSEPSPVSLAHGPAWSDLVGAITERESGLIVSPYVMMQASDARFFTAISDNVYRFLPFRLSTDERSCLHAKDERIRVRSFLDGIELYAALLRRR